MKKKIKKRLQSIMFTITWPIKSFVDIGLAKRRVKLGEFKIDQDYSSNKSRNTEILKQLSKQLARSPTDMLKVGENLMSVFHKLFYLRFCVSSHQ